MIETIPAEPIGDGHVAVTMRHQETEFWHDRHEVRLSAAAFADLLHATCSHQLLVSLCALSAACQFDDLVGNFFLT